MYSLALCACVSWWALPRSANEVREQSFGTQAAFTRRRFFFGHAELSDILDGLAILSNSVDAFQNAQVLRSDPSHPIRKRLLTSLGKVPDLSARRIGMSEVYTLPAMYFLFEEDKPREAYEIIRGGLADTRVNNQVSLLAGFVAHVFFNDLPAATAHYRILASRPDVPSWVGDLASRLERGDDPFVTNEKVRRQICTVIIRSFPRARGVLDANRRECADVSLGTSPAPLPPSEGTRAP